MEYDILSVGEMVIDFTPGPQPRSYIANPGGAPANVAIAAARLGRKSAFCGKLSEDNFGGLLYETLQENKVTLTCSTRTSANTTLAFVHLHEGGERSFTFLRNPGADSQFCCDDLPYEEIRCSKILHAGSCSLSSEPAACATKLAMEHAFKLNKIVSFDVNYRSLLWNGNEMAAKAKIQEVLPFVDLLKVSSEEINLLGGEESIPYVMAENNISLCVITYGSAGAVACYRDKRFVLPSRPTDVADTNGAGDAFWAAALSCLLEEEEVNLSDISDSLIKRMLIWGNSAGGLAVQSYGAIPAFPHCDAFRIACKDYCLEDVNVQ